MKRIEKWKEKHQKAKSFSDASLELDNKKLANSKQFQILQKIDHNFFNIDNNNEEIVNFKSKELTKMYDDKKNNNMKILHLLKSEIFDFEYQPFFKKEMFFPVELENNSNKLNQIESEFKINLEDVEINFNKLLSKIILQKQLMKKKQNKFDINKKNYTMEEITIFNHSLGFKMNKINDDTNVITNNFKKYQKYNEVFSHNLTIIISVGLGLFILFLAIVFLGGF